jgi:hypothetical protein
LQTDEVVGQVAKRVSAVATFEFCQPTIQHGLNVALHTGIEQARRVDRSRALRVWQSVGPDPIVRTSSTLSPASAGRANEVADATERLRGLEVRALWKYRAA